MWRCALRSLVRARSALAQRVLMARAQRPANILLCVFTAVMSGVRERVSVRVVSGVRQGGCGHILCDARHCALR